MFGIVRARPRATTTSHLLSKPPETRRFFSALLAFLLAASLVSSPAWAAAGVAEGGEGIALSEGETGGSGSSGASASENLPTEGAELPGSASESEGAEGLPQSSLGNGATEESPASGKTEGGNAENLSAASSEGVPGGGVEVGGAELPGASAARPEEFADGALASVSDQITVSARIVGITEPAADGSYTAEPWVGLTELTVPGDKDLTAWDVFARLLDDAGFTYSLEGGVPFSITTPDGARTLAMSAGVPWSYWSFYVNGDYGTDYANRYLLRDGDAVELRYTYGGGTEQPPAVATDPDAVRPDWESAWPGYGFGSAQGPVVSAPAPTGDAEASWIEQLKEPGDWATNVSDPVLAGDSLFIVVGDTLLRKNAETGATLASASLAAPIDTTARLAFADGMVIAPLSGGRLQAFTADALVCVWLTGELPGTVQGGAQQSLGTLTVRDGYAYLATASADWTSSYGGYLLCVNIANGAVRWQVENAQAGYYWGGAAPAGADGRFLLIADDAGTLASIDAATGVEVDALELGAGARSSVVVGEDGATAFAMTTDGVLHKVAVAENGTLVEAGSVKLGSGSTGMPALADGKVIVGGSSLDGYANDWGGTSHYGALWVIDQKTLAIDAAVSQVAGGGRLPAEVKSAPLVCVQQDGTYVYFTCNALPGGAYVYRLGDAAASELYVPETDRQNYCMASLAVGADGALYYTNDSGALFKLVSASGQGGEGPVMGPGGSNGNAVGVVDGEGAGEDGADGGSPALAGTVAPGRTPLSAAAVQAVKAQATQPEAASAEAAPGGAADAQVRAGSAAAGGSDVGGEGGASGQAPVNPWAAGGIAVGAVGLGGAAAVLLRPRRIPMPKKGA